MAERSRVAGHSVAPPVDSDHSAAEKRARRKAKVIQEIMDTEDTYQHHLQLIVNYFHGPLRENGLVEDHMLVTIFSNIQQIISVNQELRQHLRGMGVGRAFVLMAPFFKLYSTYANNHERALATLLDWDQKNAEFSTFRRSQEDLPDMNGLKLNALLITPVQRIPRYKLLLEDLLQNTETDHEDYAYIQEAVQQIGEVAHHINDHIKQQDNFMKMLAIQKSLTGPSAPKLITPGRMFIKEGLLKKVSRKGGRSHERLFVLCSDLLLYAKPRLIEGASGAYTCCCIMPLQHCKVSQVFGHSRGVGSLFTISCKDESLLLYSDQKTVDKWIEVLQKAIWQLQEHRQTLKKPSSAKQPLRRPALVKLRKKQKSHDPSHKKGKQTTEQSKSAGMKSPTIIQSITSPLRQSPRILKRALKDNCLTPKKSKVAKSSGQPHPQIGSPNMITNKLDNFREGSGALWTNNQKSQPKRASTYTPLNLITNNVGQHSEDAKVRRRNEKNRDVERLAFHTPPRNKSKSAHHTRTVNEPRKNLQEEFQLKMNRLNAGQNMITTKMDAFRQSTSEKKEKKTKMRMTREWASSQACCSPKQEGLLSCISPKKMMASRRRHKSADHVRRGGRISNPVSAELSENALHIAQTSRPIPELCSPVSVGGEIHWRPLSTISEVSEGRELSEAACRASWRKSGSESGTSSWRYSASSIEEEEEGEEDAWQRRASEEEDQTSQYSLDSVIGNVSHYTATGEHSDREFDSDEEEDTDNAFLDRNQSNSHGYDQSSFEDKLKDRHGNHHSTERQDIREDNAPVSPEVAAQYGDRSLDSLDITTDGLDVYGVGGYNPDLIDGFAYYTRCVSPPFSDTHNNHSPQPQPGRTLRPTLPPPSPPCGKPSPIRSTPSRTQQLQEALGHAAVTTQEVLLSPNTAYISGHVAPSCSLQ